MSKKVVCPYCLTKLNRGNVIYYCPECKAGFKPNLLDIFLGRIPRCPIHGTVSKILCPNCERQRRDDEDPSEIDIAIFGYKKNLSFSILGVTGCGKTIFLTVMMQKLRDMFSLSPMDKITSDIYSSNAKNLSDSLNILDATKAGKVIPQHWELRTLSDDGNPKAAYSLTFYDGAGEDCGKFLDSDPSNEKVKKYLSGSDNLVILLDPLVFRSVIKNISNKKRSSSITAENTAENAADIISSLAIYIRNTCGIKPGNIIDRNVAIVFTKFDLIQDYFGKDSYIRRAENMLSIGDYEKYMEEDANKVNNEITQWLQDIGERSFINIIKANFKSYRFFAVSSIGLDQSDFYETGKLSELDPHRILDPIMWFFAKEKVIKADVR